MLEKTGEIDALWREYAAGRDTEIRNRLLEHYVFLVKSTVRRIMPKYRELCDSDDLIGSGVMGLIDAVDKYNISLGVKFETYAVSRIRGEILDYMRKQDWAPPSLRKKISSINQAYEKLENSLGRNPSEKEVAQYLSMPVSEVRNVLLKTHMFNLMYFEDVISENYAFGAIEGHRTDDPGQIVEEKELTRILGGMVDSLPEKEKLVVTLYYYEEMTLKEIAGILGVSESRVSQIHSKVLMRLSQKLEKLI